MAILRRAMSYTPLDTATLQRWRAVPPAVAGDCLNRDRCMDSSVAPLSEGYTMVGHARTISVMAGDNAAVHAALPLIQPGEILVVTAGGAGEVAIIGEIIAECAKARGCAGIVLDGAVRDVGSLRTMGMPVYATGATPRGPHKGFGGEIDTPIACGGVVVAPGDLVLGDDDGICVVPRAVCDAVLVKGEAQVAKEADIIAKVRAGITTAELQGLAVPEPSAETN
ncbi:MAG: RraA family protein [Thalassobaculaceae bacterium]|nr:RraA family protein [Thalassobaculaceae bacterium]